MNSIKFRIAAKTDVGIVRENNEDNFQASSDLSVEPMRWVNNEICSLGEKGALLVVADGMGGMNAGEVASQIAIDTVRAAFSPQKLTDEIMNNRFSIEKFMNSVIIEADKRIKSEAKSHPESRGMGTTIVIGWLLRDKLYVSWCGDSRAYVYNPQAGLHQISKDHSYVQSLVDKGAISKDDAFDFPDSNIITRCLSDSSTKAKPESLLQPYEVCDNDIIILCTDGLSGMIRDGEIESVIRENEHNMDVCSDELIRAACDAEGADNITICMCQILQGAKACNPEIFEVFDDQIAGSKKNPTRISDVISTKIDGNNIKWKKILYAVIILCLLLAIILGFFYKKRFFNPKENPVLADTIQTNSVQKVSTQTLVAVDGSTFILERGEGEPQIGDKAYPDGTYALDAKTIVVIKDSTVVSINIKDDKLKKDTEVIVPVNPKRQDVQREKNSETNSTESGEELTNDNGIADNDELTIVCIDTTHVVKKGETLFSIGQKYGISAEDIKDLNELDGSNTIKPGDKLKIRYIKVK